VLARISKATGELEIAGIAPRQREIHSILENRGYSGRHDHESASGRMNVVIETNLGLNAGVAGLLATKTFRRNRFGSKLRVIGLIHAKNTHAIRSQPSPEGTHTT
jgi:hypothetical protein